MTSSRPSRSLAALLLAASLAWPAPISAEDSTTKAEPVSGSAPIFRFHTDGFWLNLHHFLYVLGRAEGKMRDYQRRAVANAPADQARGLKQLPPEQQPAWRAAVSAYAAGPSQLDSIFDEEMVTATRSLADAGDSLDGIELEASWAAALEQAAPIYRRTWWPEHQAANQALVAETLPLVERHGQAILDFLTRAAGLPWPKSGYPIHLSGYCNWAGAYSTRGGLLVVSSLDRELRGTTHGLEILFHEALHQWDAAREEALIAAASALGVRFPGGLDHAMLFFTAGEAVRTAIPEHVPYAHEYGLWQRRMGAFLPMLEANWRPYLHGVVSRDRALADLMRHFEKPPED